MINQLKADLKDAMKNKDVATKEVIQIIIAKANGYAKLEKVEPTIDHCIKALKIELSQLNESLSTMKEKLSYEEVEKYIDKIRYVESLLPVMASIEDIEASVQRVLDSMKDAGEVSMRQMGVVINTVKAEFGALCDGKQVSDVVKKMMK